MSSTNVAYFIDGVPVTRKIFNRRKLFGEHSAARFYTLQERVPSGREKDEWAKRKS